MVRTFAPGVEIIAASGIIVVRFSQKNLIDEGEIKEVSDSLFRLILAQEARVILDLSGVKAVSSFFIQVLLRLRRHLCGCGGSLILCRLSGALKEKIIDIMRLDQVFEICETLPESIRRFARAQ
jgi:anti-anti-sigma factor